MNDNDVETSKDIGKRRTSRERESKSSTIKANVEDNNSSRNSWGLSAQ